MSTTSTFPSDRIIKLFCWTWFFAGIETNLSPTVDSYCGGDSYMFNGLQIYVNQRRLLSDIFNTPLRRVTGGLTVQ